MKVLITTDWYAPVINGVVTSVLNLERELRKKGHEVKILTLARGPHSYISENVYYVGSFSAGAVYPDARIKIPLHSHLIISRLIKWNPDIIHSQCEFSTFLAAKKIAKTLNIPIVHTYHTVYEDYTHYFSPNKKWGRKAVSKFSKWIADSCRSIIAPTEKVSEMLSEYRIKPPVNVIPTGIDLEKFYADDLQSNKIMKEKLGISENDFVCIYIGRLAKEKNIDELIKMQTDIDNTNVKLLIVGDGPQSKELKKITDEYGISDRVIFTGMIPPKDVPAYYKCGNVFVSASTSETQGLTYIEALASGLPVICRKDRCLDGVIDDVINGFQYANPNEYCETIKELAMNPEYVGRMSRNALKSSRKFGCEIFAERAEKVYTEAITNNLSAV